VSDLSAARRAGRDGHRFQYNEGRLSVEKEPVSALQVGDQLLGKFAVERVLGQGGMGIVVQASHMVLGHKVAIKMLLPEACDHPVSVERFLREARAAVQIQSEHVARVSDVGSLPSGLPYMIMEYLEGRDLAEELRVRSTLPVEEATRYVMQALEAIAEAHSLNIVHRDLKPANVFLARRKDGSTTVKVLDFGISKALEAGEVNLTQTSSMMGSPLYMAPEQIRNAKTVDTRADVWSLGIILHECLCGRPPFGATTLSGVLAAIVADPPQPLNTLRPELPAALTLAVARCLEKDAALRVQNVHELAQMLAPFCPDQAQRSLPRIAALVGKTLPQGTEFASALTWSPDAMLNRGAAATVPGYLAPASLTNSMTAQTWSVPGSGPRKHPWLRRAVGAAALVATLLSGAWWITGGSLRTSSNSLERAPAPLSPGARAVIAAPEPAQVEVLAHPVPIGSSPGPLRLTPSAPLASAPVAAPAPELASSSVSRVRIASARPANPPFAKRSAAVTGAPAPSQAPAEPLSLPAVRDPMPGGSSQAPALIPRAADPLDGRR